MLRDLPHCYAPRVCVSDVIEPDVKRNTSNAMNSRCRQQFPRLAEPPAFLIAFVTSGGMLNTFSSTETECKSSSAIGCRSAPGLPPCSCSAGSCGSQVLLCCASAAAGHHRSPSAPRCEQLFKVALLPRGFHHGNQNLTHISSHKDPWADFKP